ncbi:MAG TPA: RNA polymerase sigma-70 factor [Cyclobacteriaceae bacterium]|nr:RNA polymerase sigma-70 factor [Cyclobacteriaceae bacterium]
MNTTSPNAEENILKRLREGDVNAFEIIFKTYWESLFQVAKSKLRSHEEAEEVVQELFASLWQKRNQLMITNLSYYLFSSVRNRIIDRIRSRMVHDKYWSYYKQFMPSNDESTKNQVYYDDLNDALEEAVNKMPDQTQKIFRWNKLEGKSIADIASLMNLSEKAIEYHVSKSLKQLRLYLKDFIILLSIVLFPLL